MSHKCNREGELEVLDVPCSYASRVSNIVIALHRLFEPTKLVGCSPLQAPTPVHTVKL